MSLWAITPKSSVQTRLPTTNYLIRTENCKKDGEIKSVRFPTGARRCKNMICRNLEEVEKCPLNHFLLMFRLTFLQIHPFEVFYQGFMQQYFECRSWNGEEMSIFNSWNTFSIHRWSQKKPFLRTLLRVQI